MKEKSSQNGNYIANEANAESEMPLSFVELQNKNLLRSLVVDFQGDQEAFAEAMMQSNSLEIEMEEPSEDDLILLSEEEYSIDSKNSRKKNSHRNYEDEIDIDDLEPGYLTSDSHFLSELANHKLLSREEVTVLSSAVQKGLAAKKVLANAQNLSNEQQLQFEQDILQGKLATEQLVRCNGRLVISIAKRYDGLPLMDRIQEGQIGLLKAIDRYDDSRGFAFSTYASWWIMQAVTRATKEQSRLIRIPIHAVELLNRSKRARYKFIQDNGRIPNQDEFEELLINEYGFKHNNINLLRDMRIRAVDRGALSLDMPLREDEDSSIGEFVPDKSQEEIIESLLNEITNDELESILEGLTPRQQNILKMRYFGTEKFTLTDVGAKYGRTRERIRQIEVSALKKIQPKLQQLQERKKDVKGFLPHERSQNQYDDIVEDILPTLQPIVAKIIYRRMYLNMESEQLADELKQELETIKSKSAFSESQQTKDIVNLLYIEGRMKIWDIINRGQASPNLRTIGSELKDLNVSNLKQSFKKVGHLLTNEQQSAFEIFFGYQSLHGLSIQKSAEIMEIPQSVFRSTLRSAIYMLESLQTDDKR